MYLALARKYRPRLFGELIAQEHVARALRGAVEQGKVAHGYLFAGPRGVGKTTAARILAMALNCERRHAAGPSAGGEPCGECPSCRRIWSGAASLDVVEIDAASNRGVDDARDLRERAMYAASQEGRHKVYIVDEAHMLTRDAWNALLKILEEPPPGVVFVFATTEPHKITNTAAPVMSRLQRFDFRRVGQRAIAERLRQVLAAERLAAEDDAVELIARVADGGLRDALSVLDQATAFGEGGALTAARVREVLGLVGDETYAELLAILAERRPADVFPFVAKLADAGVDLTAFTDGAGDLLRGLLAACLGGKPDGLSSALAARVVAAAGSFAAGDVLRMLRALEEAEDPIRRGANARLAVETLLVRWTVMDRTVQIADLLERPGSGQVPDGKARGGHQPGRSGGQAAPPPPTVRDSARGHRDEVSAPPPPVAEGEAAPPSAGPVTLEALRAAWPRVVAAAKAEKPILGGALADSEPVAFDGTAAQLATLGGNPMSAEGLTRNRAAVEAIIARVVGATVRVAVPGSVGARGGAGAGSGRGAVREDRAAPAAAPPPAGPAAGQRVTSTGAAAERLKALRERDPTLGSAIDSLDLELLE